MNHNAFLKETCVILCFCVFGCNDSPESKLKNSTNATHPDHDVALNISDTFHELLSCLFSIKKDITLSEILRHFNIPESSATNPNYFGFPASRHLGESETWYAFTERYAVSIYTNRYDNFDEAKNFKVTKVSLYVRISVTESNKDDWRMIRPYWHEGLIVDE